MEIVVGHFSGGGGGASPKNGGGDGSPLPIELLSITGKAYPEFNLINWTTASEINTSKFVIERSLNAKDEITVVGKTNAGGNSRVVLGYELRDNNPVKEAYYRLRTIDMDGKQQISKWIFVKRKATKLAIINIYPNPAHLSTIIEFTSPNTSDGLIEIRDIPGRVVYKRKISIIEGAQTYKLDVTGLEAGTYYIRLVSENDKALKVLVKE